MTRKGGSFRRKGRKGGNKVPGVQREDEMEMEVEEQEEGREWTGRGQWGKEIVT